MGKNKKLDVNTVRVIKISKEALFEFIYESFIIMTREDAYYERIMLLCGWWDNYDEWLDGFSFILLDRSVKKITFLVAWIEKLPDSNIDFEDALDFWLT